MATSGSILGNPVLRREDPGILTGAHRVLRRPRRSPACCTSRSCARRSPTPGSRRSTPATPRSMPGVVAVYTADDLDLPDHHGFMMLPPTMNRPPLATGPGALRRRHRRDGRRRDEGAGGRRGRGRDRRLRPAARGRRPRGRARRRRAAPASRRTARTSPTRWAPARSTACSTTPTSSCRQRIVNQRVAPVPMEPNGIVVDARRARRRPHAAGSSTQGPHGVRDDARGERSGSTPSVVRARRRRGRRRLRRRRQGMYVEYLLVGQGRAGARPAGEVDRDALREHGRDVARPRAGAATSSSA